MLQLQGQLGRIVEGAFLTESVHKVDTQAVPIEVALETKHMHLERERVTVEGGAHADVHHGLVGLLLLLYPSPNGIGAGGGQQFAAAGRVNVGGGKTHFTALPVTAHHTARQRVAIAKRGGRFFHIALGEAAAYERRAHLLSFHHLLVAGRHGHAHTLSEGGIFGKTLRASMSEPVVVAYHEMPHAECAGQY